MKLVTSNINETAQSTVYSSVADFQKAVSKVDFIIDDTPAANFKQDFAYADWLTAAGLRPNSSQPFVAKQHVYRTDKLINKDGFSGKVKKKPSGT